MKIAVNAIILAAGVGSHMRPLTNIMPKSLIAVKGEILIERLIRQLREKGVSDIVAVVGYMAEKFQYLGKKYGVTLIRSECGMDCLIMRRSRQKRERTNYDEKMDLRYTDDYNDSIVGRMCSDTGCRLGGGGQGTQR